MQLLSRAGTVSSALRKTVHSFRRQPEPILLSPGLKRSGVWSFPAYRTIAAGTGSCLFPVFALCSAHAGTVELNLSQDTAEMLQFKFSFKCAFKYSSLCGSRVPLRLGVDVGIYLERCSTAQASQAWQEEGRESRTCC